MSGTRYVDASELGLPPGQWPGVIRPDGEWAFVRGHVDRDADGDILSVRYDGPRGWSVVVFND